MPSANVRRLQAVAKRTRTYRLKRILRAATELERRASTLTHTIATIDEERARLLAEAAAMRVAR